MAVKYLPDPDLLEGGGSGGGGGITAEADQIVLVDSGNDNTVFLRRFVKDDAGAVTSVVDTALDGTTAYTPTGPVTALRGGDSATAGSIEEIRTVTVAANVAVQNVVLTGVGTAPYTTIEVLQLDNAGELWVGLFNTSFTAKGDDDVNVVADGVIYGVFPAPDTLVDSGGNLTIPVLYEDGGRVQFWVRKF